MRFKSAVACASLIASAAYAQGGGGTAASQCTGVTGDACQQAVDYFRYMAPQLGTAFTGANTTLGQGGALGGMRFGFIPRIAIDARVNVVLGDAPSYSPTPQGIGSSTPAAKAIGTSKAMIPMPSVDVALGVFKGIPLGVTNVGGVDLLASATYLPKYTGDEFSITPDKSLSMGFGFRVGLLQESLVAPGIGFSWLKRSLPVTDLTATGGGGSMTIDNLDLKSTAWRITASKNLLIVGLAVGYGQDKYDASTAINATISSQNVSVPTVTSTATRSNMFADLSLNLFVLKIVASGGIVSGNDVTKTYNGYGANPVDKKRTYGSVGVRLGL